MDELCTTVEHEGKQHLIFTGWDDNQTYKIGDQLKWWPKMERPGVGIDGVYSSFYVDTEIDPCPPYTARQWFVVISDGIIVDVQISCRDHAILHQQLEEKWPKTLPPRELWPEQIWIERDARVVEIKKRYAFKRAQSEA